jgi:hypothetical protein
MLRHIIRAFLPLLHADVEEMKFADVEIKQQPELHSPG